MAATTAVGLMKKCFRPLRDPRVLGRSRHRLMDIIVMAICGVIANCDDWEDIVLFAKERLAWFKRFLALPAGVPSHDTFERVFAALDPAVFERCCMQWLQTVAGLVRAEHIAIDGKTLRGSAQAGSSGLHLVSAWATEAQLSLAQVAVDAKSNEITAIPQLLQLLDLDGALVTIDAMGCQKEIAQQIVDRGGDYAFVVKGNQERLLEDVQATVEQALCGDLPDHQVFQWSTTERHHGREEVRSYVAVACVDGIRDRALWANITTVGKCTSRRTINGETTIEDRYYIGSRKMGVRRYAQALRGHWGIENNLHWQLDISLREDGSRIHNRNGAANYALLRKLAVGLLKRHPSKTSIARKRKAAALNVDFLAETLAEAKNVEKI